MVVVVVMQPGIKWRYNTIVGYCETKVQLRIFRKGYLLYSILSVVFISDELSSTFMSNSYG